MSAVAKTPNTMLAKSVVLLRRPHGAPSPKLGEDIGIKESPAPQEAPEGGLLVKLHFVSVDPYLRNRMATGNTNEVISGYVSGKVLSSKAPDWAAGDLFGALLPFTSYQTVTSKDLAGFRKLNKYLSEEELSLGIGLLGMPGSTAYAALDLMQVNEKDSVWISAATGAVGAVAGQIAKNVKKCKLVMGSAGSDAKCRVAETDFSYDKCFNYKEAGNAAELSGLVKKHAPDGIDFYFENVGGDHFTAALNNMNVKGRIAVCGAISRYNHTESSFPSESLSLGQIIYTQIRIEGFLCGDWLAGKRGNFLEDMSRWYREGLVKKRETVYSGIESWPEAFHALFTQGGDNLGKVVVRVDECVVA